MVSNILVWTRVSILGKAVLGWIHSRICCGLNDYCPELSHVNSYTRSQTGTKKKYLQSVSDLPHDKISVAIIWWIVLIWRDCCSVYYMSHPAIVMGWGCIDDMGAKPFLRRAASYTQFSEWSVPWRDSLLKPIIWLDHSLWWQISHSEAVLMFITRPIQQMSWDVVILTTWEQNHLLQLMARQVIFSGWSIPWWDSLHHHLMDHIQGRHCSHGEMFSTRPIQQLLWDEVILTTWKQHHLLCLAAGYVPSSEWSIPWWDSLKVLLQCRGLLRLIR